MTTQGSGTDHGFNNPATQEQRARILREQERNINTRSAMTSVIDPILAGRFAPQAKADFTVGRDPVVNYPRLPASSPWQQEQPGLEPPFPEDINFVEAVGTPVEQERAYLQSTAVSVEHSAEAPTASPPQWQSDDADPLPPLLSGSATAASPASVTSRRGEADALGSGPVLHSGDRQLAANHLPPPIAADGSPPFSNSGPPSIAEPSREGRTPREERSKAGTITRRFG